MTDGLNTKPICNLRFSNLEENMTVFKDIITAINVQNIEMSKLNIEIAKFNVQQKHNLETVELVREELKEVKNDVKIIKEKPGNNANTIKIAALSSMIGTMIGIAAGKLF